MIDLNYFKTINDDLGHIIGDKALSFIANKFKTIADNVIRYGGDEFIVIYPDDISIKSIKLKIENLRNDLIGKYLKVKDKKFKISFSYGICEFKKGDKFQNVLEKADKNMYNDKKAIKSKVKGIY